MNTILWSDCMAHSLDDWWQTPLGDNGMELRDLIVEGLTALMGQLKEENRLNENSQKSFKHVMKVVDNEYKKLVDDN